MVAPTQRLQQKPICEVDFSGFQRQLEAIRRGDMSSVHDLRTTIPRAYGALQDASGVKMPLNYLQGLRTLDELGLFWGSDIQGMLAHLLIVQDFAGVARLGMRRALRNAIQRWITRLETERSTGEVLDSIGAPALRIFARFRERNQSQDAFAEDDAYLALEGICRETAMGFGYREEEMLIRRPDQYAINTLGPIR